MCILSLYDRLPYAGCDGKGEAEAVEHLDPVWSTLTVTYRISGFRGVLGAQGAPKSGSRGPPAGPQQNIST